MASVKIGKRSLRAAVVCLLLLGLFALILFGVSRFQHRQVVPEQMQIVPDEAGQKLYYDGKAYRLKSNLESILLIGLDKDSSYEAFAEYLNKEQNDFLLLVVLDKQENTCTALPLNRDTMTRVWQLDVNGEPSTSRIEQLCLAHTYGSGGDESCENTVRAVENLLFGQTVDHYAALSMDAVPLLADLVGGVPVTIDTDMTAVDPRLIEGETVTLEGELALSYVRARQIVSDGTNQSRMARQEQFLRAAWEAWMEKTASGDAVELGTDALVSLGERLRSDCTVQKLSRLLERAEQCELTVLPAPAGEAKISEENIAEFYVDDDALEQTVLELFYREEIS